MNNVVERLINKVINIEDLTKEEFLILLKLEGDEKAQLLNSSMNIRESLYKNKVYIRGVIDVSNHCMCTCKFCGNSAKSDISRYRMSEDDIISSIKLAQEKGIDIIHIASGKDECIDASYLEKPLRYCKENNIEVELAIGNRKTDIYREFYDFGVKRYIMKFETSNKNLFNDVKTCKIGLDALLDEIVTLKNLGYQVGSGNIIGLPGQSLEDIANDLILVKKLNLDMASTSVFTPNKDSEFKTCLKGDSELALKYLAITNLLYFNKKISIPTNSTLGDENKCKALSIAGNMITLNLTSDKYKNMYSIYSGKDRIKSKMETVERFIKESNKQRISFKEFKEL